MSDSKGNKSKKSEKLISGFLLILLLLTLIVMGFWAVNIVSSHLKSNSASFARDNNSPIPVKTVAVENKPVSASLVTQAMLVENQELEIFPTSNSLVKAVHVQVGDLVKKGDPLVTFHSELLKAKVELEKSMTDISKEEYDDAVRNFDKVKGLFEKNLVGQDELTKATLNEKLANSKLINSQYNLTAAEFEYSQVEIKAPVGGVVTSVSAFENTLVQMSTSLVNLSVTNPIYVEAKVAQRYFSDLSLGQMVTLNLDAFPDKTYNAEILRLGYEVDQVSDTVSVYAKLDNPLLKLRPGMGGIANIELNASETQGLRIPAISLLGSNGRNAFVFVVDNNNVARLKEVSIVGYEQGFVGIKSGLEAGDNVVVVGQQALIDGDTVESKDET
ncbi:efflux RND transporter periplasmic adaptor subunit [Paraglaciecola marina]|uniref:efflux RND transporter periplasmic adaptor subunit n=1 Tax=Paraglaciecola marina TaxID=2500157 RepID=UPI00105EC36F|nr:efflux RND transporter periplasmic adaptor subunit [Paraglaciecola marina]